MMPDPKPPPLFPLGPLIGAGGLIGFAILAAAAGHLGAHSSPPTGTLVTQRELTFADRADGAVIVYDVNEHRRVDVLTGQNGFLRGTLRGLARTRKSEGVGPSVLFRLSAWSDGRLTLDDPSTGRHVELEAFGPTNTAVFGRLLTVGTGAS